MNKYVLALLCGVLALSAALSASCTEYRMRKLDTPAWANNCGAIDINSSGQIAGQAHGSNNMHSAIVWDSQGNCRELASTTGIQGSWAYDINDAGYVAGYAVSERMLNGQTKIEECAARWDSNGTMHVLADLEGAAYSTAYRINNNSECMGISAFAFPDGPPGPRGQQDYIYEYHLVAWDRNGNISDLGVINGNYVLTGFNDSGTISFTAGTGANRQAKLRSASGLLYTLSGLGYGDVSITALSESGEGCGYAVANSSGYCSGTYWDDKGVVHKLQNLPGAYHSTAYGLNDNGLIVGYSSVHGYRACAWTTDGAVTDLGTLPGDDRSRAGAVNNQGVIVGSSDNGYVDNVVVWEPVPEPSSIVALAGCLVGFCSVCYRRVK